MMPIHICARAKINLILDVTGRRADGYHDLRTVFQSLRLGDRLTFTATGNASVTLSCNLQELPQGPDNLAWQAAELLRREYRLDKGVHITLDKRIPVAAGLGGGSSDAAAVLRGLVRFWGLPQDATVLMRLAAQLGSDVPFCLWGGTALGSGRGEMLTPLPPCPHFFVVLANPGIPVSTALVYRNLVQVQKGPHPDVDGMVEAIARADREGITARLGNVLESSTFALCPAVGQLKRRMAAAAPALMCGSGATVFALFEQEGAAKKLFESLLREGTPCWLTETYHESGEELCDV
jgi:4-diphosphocytidyl-2-C-methyl-D-erythritol kinase